MYADWTAKTFAETGLTYELRQVDKKELESALVDANSDPEVHGIMIYYPVFGDRQVLLFTKTVGGNSKGLCCCV